MSEGQRPKATDVSPWYGVYFVIGVLVGIAYLTTEVGSLMIVVFGIYAAVSGLARRRFLWILAGFAAALTSAVVVSSVVFAMAKAAVYFFTRVL